MTRAQKEAAFAARLAAEDTSNPRLDYLELKTMLIRDWPEMVRDHAVAIETVRTLERKLAAMRLLMVQCAEQLGEPAEFPPWPREMFRHKGSLAAYTGEKRHRRTCLDHAEAERAVTPSASGEAP